MKIIIRTTVSIPEIPGEIEVDPGQRLRDVLGPLLAKPYFAKEVIDPRTGDFSLEGLIQVALNDVTYHGLPDGLETELHDGDTITLTLILLGGG